MMNDATTSSPAASARSLLRSVPLASLATLMRDGDGAPYASLVSVATDTDGAPILLLSDLADHTKNLKADDRASLLLQAGGRHEDPLAGERLTLMGRIRPSTLRRHRTRYLARHPAAVMYADFKDFGVYHLELERAHLVAGFGRIRWLPKNDLLVVAPADLVEGETDILEHMNQDHLDAVQLYAQKLLGRSGSDWRLTGIDSEGCDLRQGTETARLTFPRLVNSRTDVRSVLVSLVNEARRS